MFKASASVASRVVTRACQQEPTPVVQHFRALTTTTTPAIPSTTTPALQGLPGGQQLFGAQLSTVRGSTTGFGVGFADSMESSTTSLPSNITLNGLVITDEIYIPVTQAGRLMLGKSEEQTMPARRWRSWDRSQPRRRLF